MSLFTGKDLLGVGQLSAACLQSAPQPLLQSSPCLQRPLWLLHYHNQGPSLLASNGTRYMHTQSSDFGSKASTVHFIGFGFRFSAWITLFFYIFVSYSVAYIKFVMNSFHLILACGHICPFRKITDADAHLIHIGSLLWFNSLTKQQNNASILSTSTANTHPEPCFKLLNRTGH